jgi:hypothetical protein
LSLEITRVIVTEWVSEPLVPVTVIVNVPGVAVKATLIVSVEVAEPADGGVTGLGLKVAVTPVGGVEVLSVTGLLKLFSEVIVIVEVPVAPGAMVSVVGDAEIEKFGVAGPVTVSVKVVDLIVLPEVPVIVIVYVVGVVLVVVVTLIELVNVGLPLAGVKPTVMPVGVGEIEDERATDWVVPLSSVTVTVAEVLPPWSIEAEFGLTPTEKSKPAGAPRAATCAMAVDQLWKPESARYSPATQNVEVEVGVGSVAAPK